MYDFCANGGQVPIDLETAWAVEQYGAQSVYGRTLTPGEMHRMTIAGKVYRGYHARQAAQNQAEWSKANPEISDLLKRAMYGERTSND